MYFNTFVMYCNVKEISTSYSRTPLIRTLFVRIANYPDRLSPSGKFVENSTRLTCFEITGYRIKFSTVLWLILTYLLTYLLHGAESILRS